jgi:hypothetical protein
MPDNNWSLVVELLLALGIIVAVLIAVYTFPLGDT